jgi:hypothetical protein
MKLNELSPGIYKIRELESADAVTHRQGKVLKLVHLLRVTGTGERRKYFIDHDTLGEDGQHISFNRDYEIMYRYQGFPEVNRPKIRISFSDGSDIFEFEVADAWALRDIFEELPWLQKAFGYEPRRKTVSNRR